MWIGIPVLILIIATFLGLLTAEFEGWTFHQGWQYTVSVICEFVEPLNDVMPESDGGKFACIIVASWAICISAVVVGFVCSLQRLRGLIKKLERRVLKSAGVPYEK